MNISFQRLIYGSLLFSLSGLFSFAQEGDSAGQPTTTEFYQTHYYAAGELSSIMDEILSAEVGNEPVKWIAPKERRHLLAAHTTVAKHARISELLKRIDVRPKQVMLDFQILEIEHDSDHRLGVAWDLYSTSRGAKYSLETGGDAAASSKRSTLTGSPMTAPSTFAGLRHSIISPSAYAGMLEAISTDMAAHMRNAPHVVVMNGENAKLELGHTIPFVTGNRLDDDGSLYETIEYEQVGIEIDITPVIGASGDVILSITKLTANESLGASLDGKGNRVNTKSVVTQVIVENGHTLIIGGLMSQEEHEMNSGVPFLRRIPLLGALFRHTIKIPQNKELIFLITPKIIESTKDSDRMSQEKSKNLKTVIHKTFGGDEPLPAAGLVDASERSDQE